MKTKKFISIILIALMIVASIGAINPELSYAQATQRIKNFNQELTNEEVEKINQIFDKETDEERHERLKFEHDFFDQSKDIFYAKISTKGEVYIESAQIKSKKLQTFINKFYFGKPTEDDKTSLKQIFGERKSKTSIIKKENSDTPFSAIYQGSTAFTYYLGDGLTEPLDVMLDYEYSPQSPQYTRFTNIDYYMSSSSGVRVTTHINGNHAYLKATLSGNVILQLRFTVYDDGVVG